MGWDLFERAVIDAGWVDDAILRLFAADCAERALRAHDVTDERSWDAVRVARRFALGEATSDELAAAGASAWAAARGAAHPAAVPAWNATHEVAWEAAEDAAWDAARAVARAATSDRAWEAAWNAALAAEREWQLKRLLQYLDGTMLG